MAFNSQHHADKLYYDIVISNINNRSAPPPFLYFNETRNSPFVYKPDDYYLSIVRFTVDTPSLPVFTCVVQANQPDVNLSIYAITLDWTNPLNPAQTFSFQRFLRFAPQTLSATVPRPPSQTENGLQDNSGGYYYIYSYQYWISLVNQCFSEAFIGLNALVVSAGLVLPTTFSPVLTFDIQSSLAILNSDVLGYNDQAPGAISIFFNSALYQLFSSFPSFITGTANNSKNFQIIPYAFGGANLAPFPSGTTPLYTAIITYQEYSTISLWSPVLSLVFCSNTLPVVANQLSAPQILINGAIIQNTGNNSNIANIITDIAAGDSSYKPTLLYNPTGQYRLLEMVGNRPLTNLDISVFWKDRTGALVPFTLTAGSSATIKILFSKKTSDGNYK